MTESSNTGDAEHFENPVLNDGEALFAETFSENAEGGGVEESLQPVIRNIAEILYIQIFSHLFHNFPVAQFAEPGDCEDGDHDPDGLPHGSVPGIKLGQKGDDGPPWDDPRQWAGDEPDVLNR